MAKTRWFTFFDSRCIWTSFQGRANALWAHPHKLWRYARALPRAVRSFIAALCEINGGWIVLYHISWYWFVDWLITVLGAACTARLCATNDNSRTHQSILMMKLRTIALRVINTNWMIRILRWLSHKYDNTSKLKNVAMHQKTKTRTEYWNFAEFNAAEQSVSQQINT